ncbi:MAG: shikimate kinase [Planctomycetota bacterium]|jgi:shikimate kinase|nr:shikimate kinase [Planctomycetota bacterium]
MKAGKIALTGMMASGKTTLGKKLAKRLGVQFVDIDEVLAKIAGMPPADIFAAHGEDEFRALERMVIREVVNRSGPLVIALGGGSYIQKPVRDALRGKALTVYLKVAAPEIARRLEATDIASRPMLSGPVDWRERAEALATEREPAYALADLTFRADGTDAESLCGRLCERITEKQGERVSQLEAVNA